MKNQRKTITEMLKEQNQNEKTYAEDIVLDILTLIRDIYIAKFTLIDNRLTIELNNGQQFVVSVEEKW